MIELFNKTHMAKDKVVEGKLEPKYEGPYLVVRRTEFGSNVLQDSTKETLGRRQFFMRQMLKLKSDEPSGKRGDRASISVDAPPFMHKSDKTTHLSLTKFSPAIFLTSLLLTAFNIFSLLDH